MNFFASPGSRNFSKMTKSLYSQHEPQIHRNYQKCCSERELRLSWWFRVKKFFGKISNFWTFLQVRGHEIFQKLLGPYIQNTSLKLAELPKMFFGTGIKTFLMVSSKKNFSKNFKFLNFFASRGHEIFQKLLGPYIQNTSLKFSETTLNVVGNGN